MLKHRFHNNINLTVDDHNQQETKIKLYESKMEFDTQLLLDLLDFLCNLGEVSLPPIFQALRDKLVSRMKRSLSAAKINYEDLDRGVNTIEDSSVIADDVSLRYSKPPSQQQKSLSSGKWMTLGNKNKKQGKNNFSTLLSSPRNRELERYQDSSTLPHVLKLPIAMNEPAADLTSEITAKGTSNPFSGLFSDMNFSHAKARAHIYGQLHRKEKMFIFKPIRSFWAALIGSHLLIYNSRGDSRPSQVLSIKECRCRPIATPQDIAKKLSKSTFELYYNETKCFQFTASSPRKMEQWVSTVRQSQAKACAADNGHPNQKENSNSTANTLNPQQHNRNSNSSEDSGEVVLDILANPVKNHKPDPNLAEQLAKPKSIASTVKTKAEINKHMMASHSLPLRSKMIKKDFKPLPRPPPATMKPHRHNDDELIYDSISEPSKDHSVKNSAFKNKITPRYFPELEESEEQLYAELENFEKEELIRNNNKKGTTEMKKHAFRKNSSADNDGIYDDANMMKIEMEKRNKNVIKQETRVSRENKPYKQGPKVSTRTKPMKTFLNKLRHMSDSSQTEESRHDHTNSYWEPLTEMVHTPGMGTELSSAESDDDYVDNQIVENQTNRNRKKLDMGKKSFSFDFVEAKGESIYDDIVNMTRGSYNQKPSAESELESRRKIGHQLAKVNINPEERHVRTLPTFSSYAEMRQKSSEKFDDEIYENHLGTGIVEVDSIDYEEMMSNVTAPAPVHSEGNRHEQIYENVKISVHKNLENINVQQPPVVHTTPNYIQSPEQKIGTLMKNRFREDLSQSLSSRGKKSTHGIKLPQFGVEKNHRLEEIFSSKYHQLPSASDDEMYVNYRRPEEKFGVVEY